MNKFIISESEKQRILEMHQNATSRQYLMEIHSSESINVNIPWMINKEGKEIVAKSQFNVGEYYPSFSYLEGDPDIVKQLDKDTKTNPYTIKSVSLPDVTATPIGPQKFVKGNDGNYYLTGKLQIPQDIKVTWGVVGNTTIIFSDGQSVSGGVVYKKGKQYTLPTQKESDLTRIVKRVINERQYLTEEVVGDYFNTMNSIFNTQIAAYVKTGLNLPVKLQLNSDGTVSILWNNAKSFTTTSSLSQAITYNEGAGDPKSKVTRFGNELSAGWQKVSQASQNKDVQKSNTAVSAAIRSSINSVINTYFKNQPTQK